MISLRRRAIIGGAISAIVMIVLGFLLVTAFIDTVTQNRFETALIDRHVQLQVALSNADGDLSRIENAIGDPAYRRPYSGRYWQITAPDGSFVTSRSLLDAAIPVPNLVGSTVITRDEPSPDQDMMRSVHQMISLEDGSQWVVTVAASLANLEAERGQIGLSLLQAFALLGLIGIAAAIFQISAVLSPLKKLQDDVAKRWDGNEALDPDEYPEEVAPLVMDINTLLDRNRDIVARARRQAADLAHALKTPCAIMRNELESLSEQRVNVAEAQEALARVDAQLGRSLARIRAANSAASVHAQTDLSNSVARFSRLFKSMAEGQGKQFTSKAANDLKIRMDVQDIEEVLGNLLDNALKWCRSQVRLSAARENGSVVIRIEDDGPGIPEDAQRKALRAGGRLDTSTAGTGLGLAIAVDLLKAYGGNLSLLSSDDLGGLCVLVELPGGLGVSAAA